MRITVFGATGRTGRLVVEQALAAGHEVRAYVRDPGRLGLSLPALQVYRGELDDAAALGSALQGAQAVLSALGPRRGSSGDMMEKAARAITAAMRERKVDRLIWLSGAGVVDEGDGKSVSRAMVRGLMGILAPAVLHDSEACFRVIKQSGLAWTVARVPMLRDGPSEGAPRAGFEPPKPRPLCRADVAAFLLAQLEEREYLGRAPMLSR